ncbi:cache domain-containing protein [Geobacter hydrogenophilus]|uniref:Methyl-accepting chemotaxis protein n=1 Tax=Geobacter hydrogenophilus TaxID=40983 RepID=A0A9W6FYU4_9BACT|nr:methyl-accepting chemotaxis protein [Geobacter hydrogenophilus]MBT0895547.1 cache domain-containing protein [Geobacter hydrogenophilus]GLI37329.1 methyl-accepting chemotaxis protein [Geobacter hydrogenophilus]
MKLSTKISLISASLLAVSVVLTSVIIMSALHRDMSKLATESQESRMKTFWELLGQKGTEWKVADGTLKVGDYAVNGNFELPDKLKGLCGGTATIFMGDKRVSTNVLKPDGSRAVGTALQGAAYDAIFKEGKPYRGEAKILGTPYFTAYDPIKDASGKIIGVLYVGVKESEFMSSFNRLIWIVGGLVFVFIALSAALIKIFVTRSLKRLDKAVEVLAQAADGNLGVRLEKRQGKDEIDLLTGSVNTMLDQVGATLTEVISASNQVAAAAGQLQGSAIQIATGAEEVAAQAGTVATASEEMAATSLEIAHNCTMAAGSAGRANGSADSGASVVMATVEAMNTIYGQVRDVARSVANLGTRSDQIGEIVGTIEDIADQTNLLALNAAIEAARAGEQGRGFAVVADEVRALAERTTKATKEISQMIKSIQQETSAAVSSMNHGVTIVQDSTQKAGESGTALTEIKAQIDSVAQQVSQIATAAEQQTATTTEISNNIQMITQVVGETAKGAQESAEAASHLQEISEGLRQMVAHFRMG